MTIGLPYISVLPIDKSQFEIIKNIYTTTTNHVLQNLLVIQDIIRLQFSPRFWKCLHGNFALYHYTISKMFDVIYFIWLLVLSYTVFPKSKLKTLFPYLLFKQSKIWFKGQSKDITFNGKTMAFRSLSLRSSSGQGCEQTMYREHVVHFSKFIYKCFYAEGTY